MPSVAPTDDRMAEDQVVGPHACAVRQTCASGPSLTEEKDDAKEEPVTSHSVSGDDERFVREALDLAHAAALDGEVPVGCVVVVDGVVVGRGQNRRERQHDPLAHAEILALREAALTLGRWRLVGATLYVTLEPCFMCAGALVNARVDRLVYGAVDPRAGAVVSLGKVCEDARLNHRLSVTGGVLAEPCGDVLRTFFRARRRKARDGSLGETP
jgi:tRNA(adenine34) deaminase